MSIIVHVCRIILSFMFVCITCLCDLMFIGHLYYIGLLFVPGRPVCCQLSDVSRLYILVSSTLGYFLYLGLLYVLTGCSIDMFQLQRYCEKRFVAVTFPDFLCVPFLVFHLAGVSCIEPQT